MAEQAVNTIYLLGEQPDLLCGSIIKNLTAKVFTRPGGSSLPSDDIERNRSADMEETVTPSKTTRSRASSTASAGRDDTSSAFTLAQLVFVVGHVAIKHIVYLELVEREFKRRKDENAKREYL